MQLMRNATERFGQFVTNHNRIVILLLLVLTAGVAMGITQDQGGSDQSIDEGALGDSDVMQAAEYIEERYGGEGSDDSTRADVYLIAEDGSALSRDSLLTALSYQMDAVENPAVSDALATDGVRGVPNIVGQALADESDASLQAQYEAIDSASDAELESAVTTAFASGEETAFYLPTTYETGSTQSDAIRLTFTFASETAPTDAQQALADAADEYNSAAIFVDGAPAYADLNQEFLSDAAWLVIPAILLVLLVILGFAYRDVTDVMLGFTGTVISLIWATGLMGWMGLLNQQTALIAPVLVAALSIDFGFHVFMRYREYRGPEEGIRAALGRATTAVTVAFLLVTVTAAIGFLSNQFSPVGMIRELGLAITLGVVAALVIFTTLVPALKVSVDGLWERFGFDRRKTALGKGRYLSRVLGSGVTAARRGAALVIVVALIGGLVGGLAFTELDREAWQSGDFHEDPGWQSDLPEPLAYDAHESDVAQNMGYVRSHFQSDQEGFTDGGSGFTTMLVRGGGSVATPEAMETVAAGHRAAAEADGDIVIKQNGDVQVLSVLSVMQRVAATNEDFAATLADADTDSDGVPDRNVESLFDELFATAPEQAAQVLERTDGTYGSTLVFVPAQQSFGSERAAVMNGIADEMTTESDYAVTAVGTGTINDAEIAEIAEGIVVTSLLAMLGVLVTLAAIYRFVHGSLSLGVVTVVPIGLALGIVFGVMYLLGQPLTLLTALLVSITIGLGIDYNIHVSDRFAQELEGGRDVEAALREAVTGTGGALLGSAVTSGSAFSLLMIIPHPQFNSFGLIVALALSVSFLLSVFVLPSVLWLWAHHGGVSLAGAKSKSAATADD
ncbi:efflux RND transporter permease subunit [Halovenus marina]|uniref:efflux RND transporter permease subunit n=1 Tax=Halovenus marina TaxID=3396621 RepID=UPI003F572326